MKEKPEFKKDDSKEESKGRNNQRRGNRGSRGRGGNNRTSDKGKDKLPILKDDINDSTYYYDDPLIREQITNYTFNEFAGIPFDYSQPQGAGVAHSIVVPTMMRIRLAPAAGCTGSTAPNNFATDGVQRAGLKNFTKLSASNAKTTNYQPQDITKLILACSSLMEWFSFGQRILGSVYIFNPRNRDLPQELCAAQGVDYSDLISNYSNHLLRFNLLLTQFNKIPIPSNVKAFMKSSSLYNNFYVDDTSPMAQMYIPVPDGYWLFDEATDTLKYTVRDYTVQYTFAWITGVIKSMLDSLLESATFNYIYSDILRLSEREGMKLMLWTTIPFGYVAPILYSEEFNLWVDNLMIAGFPKATANTYTTPGNDVTFDPVNMKVCYKPAITWTTPRNIWHYILNFNTNNPDIESKVAATRLVSSILTYYSTDPDDKLLNCSTHYVTKVDVNIRNRANLTTRSWISFDETFRLRDIDSDATLSFCLWLNYLTKFKHAPHFYFFSGNDSTSLEDYALGDYDFFTTVDNGYLAKMFDAEWMSYLTIN